MQTRRLSLQEQCLQVNSEERKAQLRPKIEMEMLEMHR
jgi:hypothetical protein